MPLEPLVHKVLQVLVTYLALLVQLDLKVPPVLAEYQAVLGHVVPQEPQEHLAESQLDK